jgi:centrosomal protein CEP76
MEMNGMILNAQILISGPECQVPVGVLNARLTICPLLQEILSPSSYAAQINAERSIVDEKERLFLVYIKQWWREFCEIRPQHGKRFVKIFSYDENTIARQIILNPITASLTTFKFGLI